MKETKNIPSQMTSPILFMNFGFFFNCRDVVISTHRGHTSFFQDHTLNLFSYCLSDRSGLRQSRNPQKHFTMDIEDEENMSKI